MPWVWLTKRNFITFDLFPVGQIISCFPLHAKEGLEIKKRVKHWKNKRETTTT